MVSLIVALGIFTYHAMTFENLLPIFFQDERVPAGGRQVINILANQTGSFAGGLGLSVKDVGVIMSLNGKLTTLFAAFGASVDLVVLLWSAYR